ncbi:single-pass membrane and coiled-coil domain-containing protein 1 [Protopterus annectens]|uniref:single-pass membrane and coiled-coil domain-containing protein 1 n=1 Tax=Protopterus annectens TaxID=7888 RepID=UPI001CFA9EE0|nr:single-pass membrane and coiled-coil domain-containing protein 1 [Protopterus annectens]
MATAARPAAPTTTAAAVAAAEKRGALRLLGKTLTRLEQRLHALNVQFKQLDRTAENLLQRFEAHSESLAKQAGQDEMWSSLLEDRFTITEVNLFYSYVVDCLCYLHKRILEKVPDLVNGLPTLASVLKRKAKNPRIGAAWDASLQATGLQSCNVQTLCTFFVTHSYEAEYYTVSQRKMYATDLQTMIKRVVKNQILQDSLLCAVRLVETGDAREKLKEEAGTKKIVPPPRRKKLLRKGLKFK